MIGAVAIALLLIVFVPMLLDSEPRKGREDPVHLWALARLGARVPLYGPLNAVIPPARVAEWLSRLCAWDWPEPDRAAYVVATRSE